MSEKKTSFHHDTGKGSRPRSYSVSQEEFGKNWDAIFGRKDKVPEESGCSTESEGRMPDVG